MFSSPLLYRNLPNFRAGVFSLTKTTLTFGEDTRISSNCTGRDYQSNNRKCLKGADAIEVSGGIIRTGKLSPSRPGITTREKEAYFREYTQKMKAAISIPLILVGGIKSFEVASEIIEQEVADYISMSRAFVREPDLIHRWKNGDLGPAQCKSDNLCFTPGFEGKGVYCVTREIEEKKNCV